jgi:GntR family transcriptional regulator, rspAB operon transcriptional repressor
LARTASRAIHGFPAPSKRVEVYQRILNDIICRELPPGSPLDEASLARRYRAGRAGVRDALFRLSLEGMVNRVPRVGTTVADLSVFELQQIFEARLAVEVYCAGLASQTAAPDDLRPMEDALSGWEQCLRKRDFGTLVRLDQQFHQGLADATHNQALTRIVVMLHNSALRFWYFAMPRRSLEAGMAGFEKHVRVLEAVRAGDQAAAERAMRELLGHFSESQNFLGSHSSFQSTQDQVAAQI